jgi:hypothetical protein
MTCRPSIRRLPVSERGWMRLCITLFIAGMAVMVPFDSVITLALACLCFAGFIVAGSIALLRPSRLGDEE